MESIKLFKTELENGIVEINDKNFTIENLNWNDHPSFKGVQIKHLITGKLTGDQMSCHLVKIAPGCEIGLHNHTGKAELHEIVEGEGKGYIENKEIEYCAGTITFIPADKYHKVTAGAKGLFLMAKFLPALL